MKIGEGLLNKAAGTKEGDHGLDEIEKSPVLTLVPQTEKDSPKRTFRIGVSDDVFMRRDDARATSADSIKKDREAVAKADPDGVRPLGRLEPWILLTAAGLILGLLLGRHSRE